MSRIACAWLVAGTPALAAELVTISVVDQSGAPIPASQVEIAGVGVVLGGDQVLLDPASYVVRIHPGIDGHPQLGSLYRDETVSVVAGLEALQLEWVCSHLAVDLHDQEGEPLPGSVALSAFEGGGRPVPFALDLPVNDPALYPTIGGAQSMADSNLGFDVTIVPSLGGLPTGAILGRQEGVSPGGAVSVVAGQEELAFEWLTRDVELQILDQHGAQLPGSRISISHIGLYEVGAVLRIPVNEVSVYPSIFGSASSAELGYDLVLVPGVLGASFLPNGALERQVGAHPSNETAIVTPATTTLSYEWITSTVMFDLVDQYGARLEGARMSLTAFSGLGSFLFPFQASLPITDPAIYPAIAGGQSEAGANGGYDLTVVPSIEGHGIGGILGRYEGVEGADEIQVHADTTEVVLEWITADVLIELNDPAGYPIAGSLAVIVGSGMSYRDTPFPLTVPITDPLIYPTIFGPAEESRNKGYDIQLLPGLDGQRAPTSGGPALYRTVGADPSPERVLVHANTSTLAFEWHQVECNLGLVDGSLQHLPGSTIEFSSYLPRSTPAAIVLPITDNSVYPSIMGWFVDGYTATVFPADGWGGVGTFEFEVLPGGAFEPGSFVIAGRPYGLVCADNSPPTADAGGNVRIQGLEQSSTVLEGTAHDPDGDALTYRWLVALDPLTAPAQVGPAGEALLDLSTVAPLTPGTYDLALEVTDGDYVVTSRMTLTVDNSPPTVACGGSGTYQAGIDDVVLSASVGDYDGDVLLYEWVLEGEVLGSGQLVATPGGDPIALPALGLATGATGPLAVGVHSFVLSVDDGLESASCSVVANVVDSEEPTLAPMSDCQILWPPNHKMVPVTIDPRAADAAGGPVVIEAWVTSSEDPDKDGDGHTIPDFSEPVIDPFTGLIHVDLRAERAGRGPGRVYTITIRATDSSGNVSTAEVRCEAPHDLQGAGGA